MQDEFDELAADYQDVLDKIELRKRINVEIRNEVLVTRKLPKQLDSIKARQSKNLLEVLNKADLYDFLGMSSNTDNKVLYQAAEVIYKRTLRPSSKSELNRAIIVLCGISIVIFKSDQERAKYDEYLRLAPYDDIRHKVDTAAHITKVLYKQQLDLILNQACDKRLDFMESLFVILEYTQEKGYSILYR